MYVFSMKRIKYMIIFLFTHRMLVVKKILWLGQTNKIIASQANFQKFWWGREAVAAYTGNNHACLRHKRFTDNDRDQQTYGADPEMTRSGHKFFFPM